MKKIISTVMALSIAAMSLAAVTPAHAAVMMHDDFNNVQSKTGLYYSDGTGNRTNTTWEQAEVGGERVLKATVGNFETQTFEGLNNTDKVMAESEIGFPASNVALYAGICPVGFPRNLLNFNNGIKFQGNNGTMYINGGGVDKSYSSSNAYVCQKEKLYKVGFVYDKSAGNVKYYIIGNDNSTFTKTVKFNGEYLLGVTLYIKGDKNVNGSAYWNYLNVDSAENMAVSAVSPANGSVDVLTTDTINVDFSNVIDPENKGTVVLKKADGTEVSTTVSTYNGRRLVVKPSSALDAGTTYTLEVSGTKDLLGSSASANTTFTTASPYHVHYNFDNVTPKSGQYFSQSTGNAANMTWSQAEFGGEQVLKGTVSASQEALSWETLADMNNAIAEMEVAMPSANNAWQLGLRPVFDGKYEPGIRIENSNYITADGVRISKGSGYVTAQRDKFYRIGFGFDKSNKKLIYYVVDNDGQTYIKEVERENENFLKGAGIYLRGNDTTARSAYYNYLNIDRDEGLEVKNVAVNGSTVEVEYNNVLIPTAGSVVFKDKAGNETAGTFTTYNGNILKTSIPSTLKGGVTYDMVISGIKDVAGVAANTLTREIKIPAINGFVEDFEAFTEGTTYTGGNANVQVGYTLFATNGLGGSIEMSKIDDEHGMSAKMKIGKALTDTSQIWITKSASNVQKAVVGYSAYMPVPSSDAQMIFRVMGPKTSDSKDALSGINSLQTGRVFFNGQPRSWYMDETAPRWHDVRFYLDFVNNEVHLTVDGSYVRSDKIDVATKNIASLRLSGNYGNNEDVYIDDIVYYDASELNPVFSVNNGTATVEFGQEVSNVSVSTTENVTTVSERGTNPVAASFEVAEGTVLSIRTLDGVFHRYTYSGGSFKRSNIAAVDYYDAEHRYSGASSLTDTLNVKANILNNDGTVTSRKAFVALYDYDTKALVAVDMKDVEFNDGETEKSFTSTFKGLGLEGKLDEGSKRVSSVKVFVFDSLSSLNPIDSAVVWDW